MHTTYSITFNAIIIISETLCWFFKWRLRKSAKTPCSFGSVQPLQNHRTPLNDLFCCFHVIRLYIPLLGLFSFHWPEQQGIHTRNHLEAESQASAHCPSSPASHTSTLILITFPCSSASSSGYYAQNSSVSLHNSAWNMHKSVITGSEIQQE